MYRIMTKSGKQWWTRPYEGKVFRHNAGEIICSDALTLLRSLRNECADIVFLDPPFNLGKKYGKDICITDRKSESEYLEYMTNIISRSSEILLQGGALYLYHMPKWAIRLASEIEKHLHFRHWIAISMKCGFARGKRLYPAHYALLYYTKGEPAAFNRPKIPLPLCRNCQKELKDYGGYRKYVENGVNLSDVWDDISPVRHNRNKHRSSNELPEKILERIIQISGRPNGLIVDPFAGTGTSLFMASKYKMQFVGCDADIDSVKIMNQRLLAGRDKPIQQRGSIR